MSGPPLSPCHARSRLSGPILSTLWRDTLQESRWLGRSDVQKPPDPAAVPGIRGFYTSDCPLALQAVTTFTLTVASTSSATFTVTWCEPSDLIGLPTTILRLS